jgi:dipeptidyl aminopeptidase/acylaminoacyl peptidase
MLSTNDLWKQRYGGAPLRVRVARHNPERGLVVTDRDGKYELYAWNVPSGELRQLTDRPLGTLWGLISPDGEWIAYLDDSGGNETGHFVRLPVDGGESRDLTPSLPPYATDSAAISGSGAVFGLTVPGPDGFGLYTLRLDPGGEPRLLHRAATFTRGPSLSHDGRIAVWQVARPREMTFGLLAFDTETGVLLAELREEDEGSIELGPFAPRDGDGRIAVSTDSDGWRRPLIWDPTSGERTDLPLAKMEGEIVPWEWSPDGNSLLLCQTVRAARRLWLYGLADGRLQKLEHPDGAIYAPTFLANGDLAVEWQDSAHPVHAVQLDGATGSQKAVLLAPAAMPESHRWRSFTFASNDGQEVQGWLATPEGDGPFPTILETHGGPTLAQLETFMPGSQAWLDHGFAYCTVNYRGSTTFGREFARKIWGDLGRWEVEDMVAAISWLVEHGVARPDAIFLTGWSYGGYLTLQALGTHPDLWAGGMGGVVVADWVSEYEDENEMTRGYDIALFRGTLEERREQYVRSSPLTYVDRLQAPVFIIQGRNDTRDPPRQVELYEAKARQLGKSVRVHWFDAGHTASATREMAIEHQELMMRFADEVLADVQAQRNPG